MAAPTPLTAAAAAAAAAAATAIGAAGTLLVECMYTKHKVQKRKVWHDGVAKVSVAARRATVYAVGDDSCAAAVGAAVAAGTLVPTIVSGVVPPMPTEPHAAAAALAAAGPLDFEAYLVEFGPLLATPGGMPLPPPPPHTAPPPAAGGLWRPPSGAAVGDGGAGSAGGTLGARRRPGLLLRAGSGVSGGSGGSGGSCGSGGSEGGEFAGGGGGYRQTPPLPPPPPPLPAEGARIRDARMLPLPPPAAVAPTAPCSDAELLALLEGGDSGEWAAPAAPSGGVPQAQAQAHFGGGFFESPCTPPAAAVAAFFAHAPAPAPAPFLAPQPPPPPPPPPLPVARAPGALLLLRRGGGVTAAAVAHPPAAAAAAAAPVYGEAAPPPPATPSSHLPPLTSAAGMAMPPPGVCGGGTAAGGPRGGDGDVGSAASRLCGSCAAALAGGSARSGSGSSEGVAKGGAGGSSFRTPGLAAPTVSCPVCYWRTARLPTCPAHGDTHYLVSLMAAMAQEVMVAVGEAASRYWPVLAAAAATGAGAGGTGGGAAAWEVFQQRCRAAGAPLYAAADLVLLPPAKPDGGDGGDGGDGSDGEGGEGGGRGKRPPRKAPKRSSISSGGGGAHADTDTKGGEQEWATSLADEAPDTVGALFDGNGGGARYCAAQPRWFLRVRRADREPPSAYSRDDLWILASEPGFGVPGAPRLPFSLPPPPTAVVTTSEAEGGQGWRPAKMAPSPVLWFCRSAFYTLSNRNMLELVPLAVVAPGEAAAIAPTLPPPPPPTQ